MFESGVPTFCRFLSILLFFSLTACGGRPLSQTPDTPVSSAEQAGSVWVVDDPKSGGRLFLCGTIHILREEDYPLSPAYEAAYSNADRVIFELPPGAGEGNSMTSRMRELGQFPPMATLEAALPAETWAEVKKWAKTRSVDISSLNRFRPWFVSLIITSTEYAALGAKPQMGVDHYFEERAKNDHKPGEGLETVEFQLQLFAKLTPDQQREMLDQTLAEISTLPQEYDEMIDAWKRGELEPLREMLFREAAKFPDLMDLFLFDRNLSWMPRLEKMLTQGEKVMVLVGTGHFAAEKGLLKLFEERGYTVRHYRDVKNL